jgi:MFS family permease
MQQYISTGIRPVMKDPIIEIQQKGPESRNILLLGLVSLLNDISSEIIQPILPLFITSLGGGPEAVGLIGGISDGIPSILKIFAGYWSDRLGRRKPLIVGGYGLSALSKVILAFSMTWQQVLAVKALERGGKGIRSAPRDAMISESAEVKNRGQGFGLHRAMDSSGAVIGSALAYILWKEGFDFRLIFLAAGIMAVAALLPFYKVQESYKSGLNEAPNLSLSNLSPDLRRFIAIASIFALGNFSYMFFILRAQQFFTGALAVGAPLLLYILYNVAYALFSFPVGILSDRIGRKRVLITGYAILALTAAGFIVVSSTIGLVALFWLYGLVYALTDGSEKAFVSDLSCASFRCTSLGIYYGAVGFASILSGIIAGALWYIFGPEATFAFGSAASFLAALALWRSKEAKETF